MGRKFLDDKTGNSVNEQVVIYITKRRIKLWVILGFTLTSSKTLLQENPSSKKR